MTLLVRNSRKAQEWRLLASPPVVSTSSDENGSRPASGERYVVCKDLLPGEPRCELVGLLTCSIRRDLGYRSVDECGGYPAGGVPRELGENQREKGECPPPASAGMQDKRAFLSYLR